MGDRISSDTMLSAVGALTKDAAAAVKRKRMHSSQHRESVPESEFGLTNQAGGLSLQDLLGMHSLSLSPPLSLFLDFISYPRFFLNDHH
jgi:hypothetical protein